MRGISLLAISIVVGGSALAGCASSSAEIKPAYVSPLQYQAYTCQQLGAEAERISRRASEVAGVQDSNKTSDAWVTGASVILFWPAAFFIKGDGPTAAELARLKGEFEAVEQAAIQKNCNIRIQRAPVETSSVDKPKAQRADGRSNPSPN